MKKKKEKIKQVSNLILQDFLLVVLEGLINLFSNGKKKKKKEKKRKLQNDMLLDKV